MLTKLGVKGLDKGTLGRWAVLMMVAMFTYVSTPL